MRVVVFDVWRWAVIKGTLEPSAMRWRRASNALKTVTPPTLRKTVLNAVVKHAPVANSGPANVPGLRISTVVKIATTRRANRARNSVAGNARVPITVRECWASRKPGSPTVLQRHYEPACISQGGHTSLVGPVTNRTQKWRSNRLRL